MPPQKHIPVLIDALIQNIPRIEGIWVDGTFGAGGYATRFSQRGVQVFGIDQDPETHKAWEGDPSIKLLKGQFSDMETLLAEHSVAKVDGVVLDIGVSSMQLDAAARGFSFLKDGPLDMRMSKEGATAQELINTISEEMLADILFHYGEERAARRISRKIVEARPFETTLQLADVIASVMPKPKIRATHPATRSFQALRIFVNDELNQLAKGLAAAERMLKKGGVLAVVSFHSLEDRIIKRFFQSRIKTTAARSRYIPEAFETAPSFAPGTRKPILPSEDEVRENPRARSAKLRWATRTEAPARPLVLEELGVPQFDQRGLR